MLEDEAAERPSGIAAQLGICLLDHPVVADRMTRLRDVTTPSTLFRRLVAELSTLLAYEALRDLSTTDIPIDTPVRAGIRSPVVDETVLLVPVLRAGLGMVQAVQDLLPATRVAHVGMRRDEITHESSVYLNRLPTDLGGWRVVICDPMLATGGSLSQVCSLVEDRGAEDITALCLIASIPGLRLVRSLHPRLRIACAAIDPALDERAFIDPGLGDAGDRLFGPPD